jgi:hypothetical protein
MNGPKALSVSNLALASPGSPANLRSYPGRALRSKPRTAKAIANLIDRFLNGTS